MALSPKEKQRLMVALEVVNGDVGRIKIGVKKAICDVRDTATRKHLWCVLTKEIRTIIARERRSATIEKVAEIAWHQRDSVLEDARKHEMFHLMRTCD